MMTDTPESVTLVPIDRIEVLNSRDRNMKVFEEIVENIRVIGLKKPITVTEREGADGAPAYLLVCGEGRLNPRVPPQMTGTILPMIDRLRRVNDEWRISERRHTLDWATESSTTFAAALAQRLTAWP